ncbi:MAG: hypothetical protein K0U93_26740 [Gammaproteobacteria bacterium]|nr:hypothetical protein [Gammaproteobacteria bacterium]
MSVEIRVDEITMTVIGAVNGALSFQDMDKYLDELNALTLSGATWIELLDLEGATSIDLGFAAIHQLRAKRLALPRNGPPVTVILAPTALSYGISRILQALYENEGHTTEIARDRVELAVQMDALRHGRRHG